MKASQTKVEAFKMTKNIEQIVIKQLIKASFKELR